MNSYNIFNENEESTILYHAVAENESHVKALADEEGFNIEGLAIDLIRKNVVDELHRPMKPFITDAQVH